MKKQYEELELTGKYNDSFGEALKNFFGIKEEDINITTFVKMNNDFNNFMSLFNASNTSTTTIITNKSILFNSHFNNFQPLLITFYHTTTPKKRI